MYKLEINQEQINKAVNWHIRNIGSLDEDDANKTDTRLIQEFAKSINVFYDDNPSDQFWNKYNSNNWSHHAYQVLITKGKNRIITQIEIPQNSACYEKFDLTSVIQALAFEVADPDEYMDHEDKKAKKRFEKVSNKIFKLFGEDFYTFILGGSY